MAAVKFAASALHGDMRLTKGQVLLSHRVAFPQLPGPFVILPRLHLADFLGIEERDVAS